VTIRRLGQLLSLVVLTLTCAACWGPFGPVRTGADDRRRVADLRNDDRSLERFVARGDDRPDTRAVRGIERDPKDPGRIGPILDVPAIVGVSEPGTKSFTGPDGPTPDDEVSRLGGQSDGDEVPDEGDIRSDDPRDIGQIDSGLGGRRQLPGR
jgi:hypothetical protein